MVRILSVLFMTVLAGCASQTKRNESELAQLLQWYSGDYRSSEGTHTALDLVIVPIYAPRIAEQVFYLQESAVDNPQRILTQRLVSFAVVEDRGIVQSLWTLSEPLRWRDAQLNTDLFKGLMPQDFNGVPGCDLLWRKEAERFVAATDSAICRQKMRVELSVEGLTIADQSEPAEVLYRFRRR
jgi:hypothetical protein